MVGKGALLRSVSAGSLSLAPSDLPPPIRVSHSMTDGISAYAGEFGGFKVEGGKGQAGGGRLMLPVKEADNKDVGEKAEKKENEG